MNRTRGAILCVILATSGLVCVAQNAAVPFKRIARDAQLSARLRVPVDDPVIRRESELTETPSAASGVVDASPEYKPPRVLSKAFVVVNGLHLGMVVLDVGMTQHCLANHHCREGNPLVPTSLAGQLGVGVGWVGSTALVSYHLKKEDSGMWWFAPAMGIAAHTVGAVSGFVNR